MLSSVVREPGVSCGTSPQQITSQLTHLTIPDIFQGALILWVWQPWTVAESAWSPPPLPITLPDYLPISVGMTSLPSSPPDTDDIPPPVPPKYFLEEDHFPPPKLPPHPCEESKESIALPSFLPTVHQQGTQQWVRVLSLILWMRSILIVYYLQLDTRFFTLTLNFNEKSSLSWKQIKWLIYVWQLAITP